MTPPGRPRQGRSPLFVVRQIGRRAARQQELHHLRLVSARGPRQRRGAELLVSRRDGGARVEQDGATFAAVVQGGPVEQRLVLPVHLVGAHAVCEQHPQRIG